MQHKEIECTATKFVRVLERIRTQHLHTATHSTLTYTHFTLHLCTQPPYVTDSSYMQREYSKRLRSPSPMPVGRFFAPRRVEEIATAYVAREPTVMREPTVVVDRDEGMEAQPRSPVYTLGAMSLSSLENDDRSLTPVVATEENVSWVNDKDIAKKFVREVSRLIEKYNRETHTDASLYDAYTLITSRLATE